MPASSSSGYQTMGALPLLLAIALVLRIGSVFCLTDEGLALLAFRKGITADPHGILGHWSEQDDDPCKWPGIRCLDSRVDGINLSNLSLEGVISKHLGKLASIRILDLSRNHLSGTLPSELENCRKLLYLNVAYNQLGGFIPEGIQNLVKLRSLNLRNNSFMGFTEDCQQAHQDPCGICNLKNLRVLDLSYNLIDIKVPGCLPRSLRHHHHQYTAWDQEEQHEELGSLSYRILLNKGTANQSGSRAAHQSNADTHRPNHPVAVKKSHPHRHHGSSSLMPLLFALPVIVAVLLIFLATSLFLHRRRTAAVSPWKLGMSGHLQKTFSTEVPSVSWTELQAACEDFSNIIGSSADCVVFKGTLSDGTEVAVTSLRVSPASWSASSEVFFRRKVEALARMKHTHLVNLVGFCAEEDPFARMLLFEYAPNGTVFEHLHNTNSEHLDWPTRMRIVMGAAYGLEYMHHDLLPPASHSNFDSNAIYLTEDYAAKLADFGIQKLALVKADRRKSFSNAIGYDDLEGSDRHSPDFLSNVHSFGLFVLEVVTGRLPYSQKEGPLLDWALDFLGYPETIGHIVDPSLKDVDVNQLLVVCDIVRLCINHEPSKRPSMKTVVALLSKGLKLSADLAKPKSSPLLWAELEILSPV